MCVCATLLACACVAVDNHRKTVQVCACAAVGMCVCGCWHVCVCGCWHVRVWLLACACGCWHVRVWLLTFSGRQFRYVVPLTLHDLLEEINEMQMPKTVQVCSAADSIT